MIIVFLMEEEEVLIVNENIKAFVIRKVKNDWRMVCLTEITKDGEWACGMNLITSIDEVLDEAEKNNLPIIFEKTLTELKEK